MRTLTVRGGSRPRMRRASVRVARGVVPTVAALLAAALVVAAGPRPARGQAVADVMTAKTIPASTVAVIDPETGSSAGGGTGTDVKIRVGDIIQFRFKFSPVPDNAHHGLGTYMTEYIPPNTQVVGARIIDDAGNTVRPRYPGIARFQCNDNNCNPFVYNSTSYPDGSIAQVYADTGIFFFAPTSDTRIQRAPADQFITLANGSTITPTPAHANRVDFLIGATAPYKTHELWDWIQEQAFGAASGSMNGGTGITPFGYGSPVAGPDTLYQYEASLPGATIQLSGTVGPWQRVRFPGSLKGTGVAPTSVTQSSTALVRMISDASDLGWDLTPANPLPAGTRAVRFSMGEGRAGENFYAEIALKVTGTPLDPGFLPSPGKDVDCGEAFGGDLSASTVGRADDNAWPFFIPSPACVYLNLLFDLTVDKLLPIVPGDQLNYTLHGKNLSINPATNVKVRLEFDSTDAAYVSNDGGAPVPTACTSPTVAGKSCLTFPTIASLAPSGEYTFHVVFNPGGAGHATNVMVARYISDQLPGNGFTVQELNQLRGIALPHAAVTSPVGALSVPGTVALAGTIRNDGSNNTTFKTIALVLPGAAWRVGGGATTNDDGPITISGTGGGTFTCSANCTSNTPEYTVNLALAPSRTTPADVRNLGFSVYVPSGTASGAYPLDLQMWNSQSGFGQQFETYVPRIATLSVGLARSTAPVLTCPINVADTTVSGTTVEAAGTTIRLYFNGAQRSSGLTTGSAWTLGGFSAFGGIYPGLEITATAQAPGELESLPSASCPGTTVFACDDGVDNDGDGKTDFPADPGCVSPNDQSEVDAQCVDGIDNEGDGRTDWPADLECLGPADDDESGSPGCSDGIDNDGDGATDYPGDIGCAGPSDPTEVPEPACMDRIDNDGDGLTDFPADPGCHSPNDASENELAVTGTDVKARLLFLFDTSGSMNWNTCSSVFTGGDGSAACPGGPVDCATCNGVGCGNAVADDSRIFKVKKGLSDVVAAFGEVDWGLMRFHQGPVAFACPGTNAGMPSGGWQGAGIAPCGGGYNAADLLVSFSPYNQEDLVQWMDGSSNYAPAPLALTPPPGHDIELRGTGATPLAGSLQSAMTYLGGVRIADAKAACRPYRVILVTDGAESCGGDAAAQAAALYAAGIRVNVIGFATTDATIIGNLNSIARAGSGGTTDAILVDNSAALSTAMGAIVSQTILIERCNGLDDDCDGLTDEDFADKGASCDNGQKGLCLKTGVRVCAPDQLGTVCNALPGTPGTEICNGLDDDCDGAIDEAPLDCTPCTGVEVCNGVDDDCNGLTDDNIPVVACGANIGQCTAGTTTCVAGVPGCTGGVGPVAESCDGKDDDCDGIIDGFDQACYPSATVGCTFAALSGWTCVGACQTGLASCPRLLSSASGNSFGACQGAVTPLAEIACDGVDNDCNGLTDDGFGLGTACGSGVGECRTGTWQCSGGTIVCVGGVGPSVEICDGKDNNCDGGTDNLVGPCGPTLGECEAGTRACSGGVEICVQPLGPKPETCNGKDDDCDGAIDDNLTEPQFTTATSCGSNVGVCRFGSWRCVSGTVVCDGGVAPQSETCNDADDDCDGCTDCDMTCLRARYGAGATCPIAGSGQACGSSVGACRQGGLLCQAGVVSCVGAVGPTAEVCDAQDNDCNGFTDETDPALGTACYPGATGCNVAAGSCTGECRIGARQCVASGPSAALSCVGSVVPAIEVCNGKDDDCNGAVDNGFDVGTACTNGGTGACLRTGVKICSGSGAGTVCNAPAATGTAETCNGIDDDCDGLTDNLTGPCGSTLGECKAGTRSCSGGVEICVQPFGPKPETCNNKDDDCDGTIDDPPMAGVGVSCGSNIGECRFGSTVCVGGVVSCQGGVAPAATESCNDRDDDCDGCTDCDMACLRAKYGAGATCSVPGSGLACGSAVGACVPGGLLCVAGVVSCVGAVTPASEACNGKDDDCNGFTDESDPALGTTCYPAATAGCDVAGGSCTGECRLGTKACVGAGTASAAIGCAGAVVPVAELCDRKDNNCDGATDEGFDRGASCDNGLLGACHATGVKVCNGTGTGTVCSAPTPGAVDEICNGLDDDCDGVTDNLKGPCGSTLGECKAGTRECSDGGEICVQPFGPKAETCNGKDDDCDGAIDNDVTDADIVTPTPCGSDVGICRKGTLRCIGGAKICEGGVAGTSEVCNNADDDCDGCTDCDMPCLIAAHGPGATCPVPGAGQACGTDVGECGKGSLLCTAGAMVCSGQTGPFAEICDGLDNDCNGFTDEDDPSLGTICYPTGLLGCTVATGVCVGECMFGARICDATGAGLPTLGCANPVTPKSEVCDGKDNDCDGATDNGFDVGAACDNGATGMCRKTGTKICNARGDGTTCSVAPSTTSPEVCNGLDDDCDGTIDNPPLPGVGDACGSDVGECVAGKTVCTSGGTIVCSGDVGPTPEVCNGLDDDCDGSIDEDLTAPSAECPPPGLPPGAPIVGECKPGKYSCMGKAGWVCKGSTGPVPEICDGKDNDCDGKVDNDATCPSKFSCMGGECVPECATGEFKCPGDRMCVGSSPGYCVPNKCAKAHCGPGTRCDKDGNCIDLCMGVTCPEGATCVGGVCQDCHTTGCPDGQICTLHTCEPDPCVGITCGADEYCSAGACVSTCAALKCPSTQICHHGTCADNLCWRSACNGTEFCDPDDGLCKPNPCSITQCMLGEQCVSLTGMCEPDPCLATHCVDGEICRTALDGHAECIPDPGIQPPPPGTNVTGSGGGGCTCRVEGGAASGRLALGGALAVGLIGRWRRRRRRAP